MTRSMPHNGAPLPPRPSAAGRGLTGLSRRGVLQGALGFGALAAAGTLAGCSGNVRTATAGGPLVRVWDLLGGSDGELMDHILDDVRGEVTDAVIDRTTLAWGPPYYTKLAMAAAGGRAPEAAIVHLSRLIGYAPGGLLEPFDLDMLAEVGITEADFLPALWERALYEGELYALPLDTHPVILFYDPAVAEQAGLIGDDRLLTEITSPEEFLDAGCALAEVTGDTGIAYGYLNDGAQAWRLFWGLYGQKGAEYDLTPGRPAELDVDAATEILEFMQSMLDGTVTAPNSDYGSAIANFNAGRAGAIISGDWELNSLRGAVPDVSAVPLPIIYDQPAAFGDSHAYVLPRQISPDPERRRATYEVLAAILREGKAWAGAGHIPTLTEVVESQEYQEMTPQANYAEAGEWIFLDPPVWFTGSGSDFQNRMCQEMQRALLGLISAEEGVQSMLDEMNVLLSSPAPA